MEQKILWSPDEMLLIWFQERFLTFSFNNVPHLHVFYYCGSHYCNFWLMYVQLGDFHNSRRPLTVPLTQILNSKIRVRGEPSVYFLLKLKGSKYWNIFSKWLWTHCCLDNQFCTLDKGRHFSSCPLLDKIIFEGAF